MTVNCSALDCCPYMVRPSPNIVRTIVTAAIASKDTFDFIEASSPLLLILIPNRRIVLFTYQLRALMTRAGERSPRLHPASQKRSCLARCQPAACCLRVLRSSSRSEEHTSELQSLRHLVCRL